MNIYYWNTDIGEFIATGTTQDEARQKLLRKLGSHDGAFTDLQQALDVEPEVNPELTVLAWEH